MSDHLIDQETFGSMPIRASIAEVSTDPDIQVEQVITMMARYAVEDSRRPEIIADAQEALALYPGDPVTAVWAYVRSKIDFTRDESQASHFQRLLQSLRPGANIDDVVEVLIRPVDMHYMCQQGRRGKEDCDGFSMYAASLLLALDVTCRFCTIAAEISDPNMYSHVYVVAYPGGQRCPVDASHGPQVGYEARHLGKIREWPVGGLDLMSVFAIGAVLSAAAWMYWKGL